MAPTPKHDYDSDRFYELIERSASVLAYDKQIAVILGLDEETFISMKNGNYHQWTAEENKRRGDRIVKVLARARANSTLQAWNTVLRFGLGKYKTRSRQIRAQAKPCDCGGKPDCPLCGGIGYIKDTQGEIPVTITESENELAPSLQAITLWLYHHDPNYRKVQRGEDPETGEQLPPGAGISIDAWLRREIETSAAMMQDDSAPAVTDDNPQ